MTHNPGIYQAVMAAFDSKVIPQRTVADESGVPFSTVCKIAQRDVKSPSVHSVQQLYDYFAAHPLTSALIVRGGDSVQATTWGSAPVCARAE